MKQSDKKSQISDKIHKKWQTSVKKTQTYGKKVTKSNSSVKMSQKVIN